jgi:hypothetical protein
MKGYLTSNQFNYVLYHLNMSLGLSEEIYSKLHVQKDAAVSVEGPAIVFQLSSEPLDLESIVEEKGVPILFPSDQHVNSYSIQNDTLVFHHDLIKSAFYLLSGYQELDAEYLDKMGRFPYELSVQSKLKVPGKPLVNYYFEIISEGIKEFCKIHQLPIESKQVFEKFCFFPSHDVDHVETYTIYEVIYRFKQALALVKPQYAKGKSFRVAFKYLFQYLNIINRKNPHWTFPFMREVERANGFRSAFYFLPKDLLHKDAYYSFQQKRIRKLFSYLHEEKCEIGLHGTVRSSKSSEFLLRDIEMLKKYSPQKVLGIRQHRLLYDIHTTSSFHEGGGLLYDTTLGFAEQEGFRNSYCLPFRVFDHKNDKMLELWELPLNVMDVTLFHYQEYTREQAKDSILTLMREIKNFKGVFTFLWHNSFFEEDLYPGITAFYSEMMKLIADEDPICLLGAEIVQMAEDQADEVFSIEV